MSVLLTEGLCLSIKNGREPFQFYSNSPRKLEARVSSEDLLKSNVISIEKWLRLYTTAFLFFILEAATSVYLLSSYHFQTSSPVYLYEPNRSKITDLFNICIAHRVFSLGFSSLPPFLQFVSCHQTTHMFNSGYYLVITLNKHGCCCWY